MNTRFLITLIVMTVIVAACGLGARSSASLTTAANSSDPASDPTQPSLAMIVYKNASCGCCRGWIQHLQSAGFQVRVENVSDLGPIKRRVGVPLDLGSCHTAHIGSYFVEGHVPVEDVKRLLAERPHAKGLVTPGMPVGSPGMPGLPGQHVSYDVLLVGIDGTTSVFAHHGG